MLLTRTVPINQRVDTGQRVNFACAPDSIEWPRERSLLVRWPLQPRDHGVQVDGQGPQRGVLVLSQPGCYVGGADGDVVQNLEQPEASWLLPRDVIVAVYVEPQALAYQKFTYSTSKHSRI